ncbi:RcnB family protein [Luteimonas sp. SDU101]|uniref:RcnB family protein n=1 Tax=Luteimonas sp. SDU101 TaxID=3422593 RepID=UPI003EB970C9
MNRRLKWGTALVLALAAAAAPAIAMADNDRRGGYSHRDHDRRGHDRHERRWEGREHRRDHRHARRDDRRDHRYERRDHRRDDRYSRNWRAPVVVHHRPVVRHYHPAPRHVGPPRWARGGYVHHYQRPIYVVNDYYGYGLRHPPRGHRWMRDDRGDMLLVAIATGLIVDMILR